ncbi:class I SAM-dependent methyltransferase [Hwanghaeella grinnelliae]|uniref:Class I SAM-dependent methyltransferase n=1 Tax=Hwanghaeella grinnelliae TaxID=2500179 RepID=A0A437QY87_9PROT|nr:class I SAM-dependent methyltransferase [Hwanghaeella grinnelliae]RVU39495.1 class I SAM-dependent methyltransferase [Hwanghaeella grinnelliae]
MVRPERFWNKLATIYAKHKVADESAYRRKLTETQRHFTPHSEVLEIGCGTGTTALIHAPFVNHIRATDFSAKMLEIAREKADIAGIENVSFEQAAVDDLVVSDGSVDVVMAHSIFHLLPDWRNVLPRTYRMLKPGGVLVSSTTCLGDGMGILRIIGPVGSFLGVFPVLAIFTRADFLSSIREAGFAIEEEWQPGKGKAVFIIARKPI